MKRVLTFYSMSVSPGKFVDLISIYIWLRAT